MYSLASVTSLIALRWAAEAWIRGCHESHRHTIYNVGKRGLLQSLTITDPNGVYRTPCFNRPYAF